MALPASGIISLGAVNQEMGRNWGDTISLNIWADGNGTLYVQTGSTNAVINPCSSSRPLAANPDSLSEWYNYNHSASCGPNAPTIHAAINETTARVKVSVINTNGGNGTAASHSFQWRFNDTPNTWYDISPNWNYSATVNGQAGWEFFFDPTDMASEIVDFRVKVTLSGVDSGWSNIVTKPIF